MRNLQSPFATERLLLVAPALVAFLSCTDPITGSRGTGASRVASVEIAAITGAVEPGDSLKLQAVVKDSQGQVLSGKSIEWTSINPAIATVSPEGMVRAISTGDAQIVATVERISASMTVRVEWKPTEVWPDTNLLLPTMERVLVMRTSGPSANPHHISGAIWSSSDPSVAQVDAAGRVTAVATGEATITAAVGDRQARAHVRVTQYDRPLRFASVGRGWSYACGLTIEGAIYCWGDDVAIRNAVGGQSADRCDRHAMQGHTTILVRFRCIRIPVRINSPAVFVGLTVGQNHSCAWTASGEGYCWGANLYGQLGVGSNHPLFSAVPLPVTGTIDFRELRANGGTTCGFSVGGELFCWGHNLNGALGIGAGTPDWIGAPQRVQSDVRFIEVAVASISHSCAIAEGGAPYCWGTNLYLARGVGPDTTTLPGCAVTCLVVPTPVVIDERFASIASTFLDNCGVTSEGIVFCWGGGAGGYRPPSRAGGEVRLASFHRSTIADQMCGLTHTGEGYCVARGGVGEPTHVLRPVLAGMRFLQAELGGLLSCGIATDGLAYCAGSRSGGALGSGDLESGSSPAGPTLIAGQR